MKSPWILIAFVAGAFLPIQAGLNAKLGKSLGNPVYAALLSFLVGSVAIIGFILLTRQQGSWQSARTVPAYVWLGGILGSLYVTATIMALPRIGTALTFGLVIAGQMLVAVLLDHFNILVAQQHSINAWRIFGMVLIIAGVVIVRKF